MKKVLIVTDTYTHPTNQGNSYAIFAQANILKKIGCDVHILYFIDSQRGRQDFNKEIIRSMSSYWGKKFHYFTISSCERIVRNRINVFCDKYKNGKHSLYDTYPWHLTEEAIKLHEKFHFDVCIVNYIFLTKVYDRLNIPIKACFTHDTFAYKNLLVNEKCKWVDANSEAVALQKCTDILAIQQEEMNYFKVLAPQSNHYTVYTPFEYHPQKPTYNHNIIFLSGGNIYNQNGLRWFIEEVFPLVQKKYSDAELLIGGGICKAIENQYSGIKGIKLFGYINDPYKFYSLGDVSINPTYQGTGLKIKTFESIANDKVTIVHPHSMMGIFASEKAPLFCSASPLDWLSFIEYVWDFKDNVEQIKSINRSYMSDYNTYILNEYKRLLGL